MSSDPAQLKMVKDIGSQDILMCLTRVPGTERLIYGSSDFKVYDLDMAVEKPKPEPLNGDGHGSYVTGITLAGRHIVSGGYDCRLVWWDASSRTQVRAADAHEKWIRRVQASPDGTIVASVGDDCVCKLWDAESGKLLHTLTDHKPITPHNFPSMLFAIAFSRDGRLMATGDKVGHVAIWEMPSAKKVGEIEAPLMYTWDAKQRRHSIGGIRSLAFSPDGKHIAVGGTGQIGNVDHLEAPARLEIFEWATQKRTLEMQDAKYKGLIERLEWHPSGAWIATCGGDHKGFVSFYEPNGKVIRQLDAHQHSHDFAFNDDYTKLFTVHHGRLQAWSLKHEPAEAEIPATVG